MKMRINMGKGRFAKMLNVLFKLLILTLVFSIGGYLGQVTFEPQVITEREVQTIVIETEVYIPVERVVEKVIEKEVYVPVEKVIVKTIETLKPLRHFQYLNELERWLTNEVLNISFNIVDDETGQRINTFDCEDYALKLQERALGDGYLMSFEVIYPVEYNALFKQGRISNDTIHAVNLVIIGNKVYYIEPQNHEIVFVAYLDYDA